jgi:hypothetical protein
VISGRVADLYWALQSVRPHASRLTHNPMPMSCLCTDGEKPHEKAPVQRQYSPVGFVKLLTLLPDP